MSVRAKFVCVGKEHNTNDPDRGSVRLDPVRDGSEENKNFYSMTPGGQIVLSTVNPAAFAQFEPSKEYYVDFTEVEPPATGG